MGTKIIFPILLLISGCASPAAKPKTAPVLFTRQLQSQVVIVPQPPVSRVPQDVSLQWIPPAEPDAAQVVSYNLYVGTSPDLWGASVIPVGDVTNAVVPGLVGGNPYYFAITDLGVDGTESDYSLIVPYTPALVVDLRFAFDQPVTNVVLQASPDFIHWQDVGIIPTNGVWRITPDTRNPMVIFRSSATTVE